MHNKEVNNDIIKTENAMAPINDNTHAGLIPDYDITKEEFLNRLDILKELVSEDEYLGWEDDLKEIFFFEREYLASFADEDENYVDFAKKLIALESRLLAKIDYENVKHLDIPSLKRILNVKEGEDTDDE